jgi:hypothetical protein
LAHAPADDGDFFEELDHHERTDQQSGDEPNGRVDDGRKRGSCCHDPFLAPAVRRAITRRG